MAIKRKNTAGMTMISDKFIVLCVRANIVCIVIHHNDVLIQRTKMAAMHWEARRKQVVVDKKSEVQQRLKDMGHNSETYYNEANIRRIAEEVSRDVATPISSMLNRSYTQLAKRHSASARPFKPLVTFEEKMFDRRVAKERIYSAKIPNRYSSINYTQQY